MTAGRQTTHPNTDPHADPGMDRVLHFAALFDGPFSIDWMIQLTGCKASEAFSLLNSAVARGYLEKQGESHFVFADEDEKSRFCAHLSDKQKQGYHERIVEILIAELPDDEDKARRLCPHLLHTQNDPPRCRWLYAAGSHFLKDHRIRLALACFAKIIEDLSCRADAMADPLFIDTAIAYAKHASIRYNIDGIVKTLEQAIENAETVEDGNKKPLLYMLLAHNEWLRGNFEASLKHFETGRRLSRDIKSPELKMYALTFSVYFYYWQGMFARAVAEYEERIPPEKRLPHGRFPYFPGIVLGLCYAQIGRIEHGITLIDHVREYSISKPAPFLAVAADITMACVLLLYERYEEAVAYIDAAEETGARAGIEVAAAFCNLLHAYCFTRLKQTGRAAGKLTAFWRQKTAHEQVVQWLYPVLIDLAMEVHRGSLPAVDGLDVFEEIEKAKHSKNLFHRGFGYRYEAACLEAAGESRRKIVSALESSKKDFEKTGSVMEEIRTRARLLTHYRHLDDTGEIEKTRTAITRRLSDMPASYVPRIFRALTDHVHADTRIVEELLQLGKTLDNDAGTERFLQAVIEAVNGMIGAERGALLMHPPSEGAENHFKPMVASNMDESAFSGPGLRPLHRFLAQAAEGDDGRLFFPNTTPAENPAALPRSAVAVPIELTDGRRAVLYHDHRLLGHAFSEKDISLLQFFGRVVALAMEEAACRRELDRQKRRRAAERIDCPAGRSAGNGFDDDLIIGETRAIQTVLEMIAHVAATDATVLILGETGVGKELVARSIHRRGKRADNPFISVNCNAIPETIISSELFGHEKGAFTGASRRRIGRFELADGGTLFLDEIGDLPMDIQVGLLRILQTGEFERVGGNDSLHSDFRLIAATNRDLQSEARQNRFRKDLFYRLNIFPIHVPPLRERKEDIPLLVRHLLAVYAEKHGKTFDRLPQAELDKLMARDWPGNVRELENTIQRGVILSNGKTFRVPPDPSFSAADSKTDQQAFSTLKEMEANHIRRALARSRGKIRGKGGAAEMLAIHPSTLRSRMKKLGIERPEKP